MSAHPFPSCASTPIQGIELPRFGLEESTGLWTYRVYAGSQPIGRVLRNHGSYTAQSLDGRIAVDTSKLADAITMLWLALQIATANQ